MVAKAELPVICNARLKLLHVRQCISNAHGNKCVLIRYFVLIVLQKWIRRMFDWVHFSCLAWVMPRFDCQNYQLFLQAGVYIFYWVHFSCLAWLMPRLTVKITSYFCKLVYICIFYWLLLVGLWVGSGVRVPQNCLVLSEIEYLCQKCYDFVVQAING